MPLLHWKNVRWNIRTHLTWVVLLAVLPALGIQVYSGYEHRRSAQEDAFQDCSRVVREIASQQDEALLSVRQMLTTLSQLPEIRHQDREKSNAALRSFQGANPKFLNIVAADAGGRLFATSTPSSNVSVHDRKYFQDAMGTGRFSTGEFVFSRTTGTPTLHCALPVRDAQGSIVAAVVAAYDPSAFDSYFERSGLPKGSTLTLFDHKGTVLHRFPAAGAGEHPCTVGMSYPLQLLEPLMGPAHEGTFRGRKPDGEKMMYAFHQMVTPETPQPYLFIQVGVPQTLALALGHATYVRNLLLLLLTGGIALCTALTVGNWAISSPIRRLAHASHMIGEGTLKATSHLTHASSEVTELAEAMDNMRASLALREEERREAQKALQRAQKMESLGVLAGGIAHDFNNLLAAMLGNLNLAQLKLGPSSSAHQQLERVEQAITKATDLTRQILAYTGRGHFVVQPHDLNKVVQEMANFLSVSISKKGDLLLELESDIPPVQADAAQLQQVILNLVTNASDSLGEGEGHILIRTGKRVFDAAQLAEECPYQNLVPGTYVCLEVRDTGCGISPELMDRIFDPFFTTKPQGHGLGLSAMMGILQGHGAGINITSTIGEGTCFRLYFPASSGKVESDPKVCHDVQEIFYGTVLVVDDDPFIREFTGHALELMGFTVLIARDGLEALEVLKAHQDQVRLVLMDITMPRMDGREAFQAMRTIQPRLPIILSSGYNEQASVSELLAQGLGAFISKPYQINNLKSMVGKILRDSVNEWA